MKYLKKPLLWLYYFLAFWLVGNLFILYHLTFKSPKFRLLIELIINGNKLEDWLQDYRFDKNEEIVYQSIREFELPQLSQIIMFEQCHDFCVIHFGEYVPGSCTNHYFYRVQENEQEILSYISELKAEERDQKLNQLLGI